MDKKYICYIGRPSYQKNTLFLVDVVRQVCLIYPDIQFLLLGVGYYSPELEIVKRRIEDWRLGDKLILKPWLEHNETLKLVKESLFYITVARYEGLPLSVIEAMSLGKAVIASDVVGNKDCVIHEYNGFLIPMETGAFVTAISTLIEDGTKREMFSRNSRKLFEEKFLIERRIYDLEDIYNNV